MQKHCRDSKVRLFQRHNLADFRLIVEILTLKWVKKYKHNKMKSNEKNR